MKGIESKWGGTKWNGEIWGETEENRGKVWLLTFDTE